jgi:hypothetical protein
MKLYWVTLAVAMTVAVPAWAQEQAQPGATGGEAKAEEKVQVSGVKNPALRPYRIMTRGLDAFDKHHALAPKADLRFELWNADGTIPRADGLGLRLAGDKFDQLLPVDAEATFILPRSQEALDDNADLVLNRKKEEMQWRPRVRSPGVPDNARRLGDMRLECEVAWAVMKDQMSFVVRTALTAAGGMCRAPMTVLSYRAPKRLASVTLVSGERSRALKLGKDTSTYIVPLRDKEWDDESLIVYKFADADADAPAPAQQAASAP